MMVPGWWVGRRASFWLCDGRGPLCCSVRSVVMAVVRSPAEATVDALRFTLLRHDVTHGTVSSLLAEWPTGGVDVEHLLLADLGIGPNRSATASRDDRLNPARQAPIGRGRCLTGIVLAGY